jgi:hypothetical protein
MVVAEELTTCYKQDSFAGTADRGGGRQELNHLGRYPSFKLKFDSPSRLSLYPGIGYRLFAKLITVDDACATASKF